VKDVELTRMEYLIENFQEYIELRDKLMSQTPYLRGQAGGLLRTSPRPTLDRRSESARLYEHSPSR